MQEPKGLIATPFTQPRRFYGEGQVKVVIKGRTLIAFYEVGPGEFVVHTWAHADGRTFRNRALEDAYNFLHADVAQLAYEEACAAAADRY